MAKTRKKPRPGARRGARKARKTRHGMLARLWKLTALATGLVLGLALPWALYLDYQVTREFEGRKWDLPSRVYARPLSLYLGREITAQALVEELAAAGYRAVDSPGQPGSYRRSGREFEIHRRSFRFDDGAESPLRFRVGLGASGVDALLDGATGESLDLVRLDPAEIASIFPLHAEDRTVIAISEAPELLLTGLQAVEDRQFKHHPGVDLRGIARALWANIRAGRAVQGGSTLTQQLVKNYYLSNERSLLRKINEAAMALSLEWHYDKSEILEAYLNEVYLGQQGSHGIHGFARAAEFYFGVPVGQLQPHQSALLIGLVRGASLYNPRRHPERALERRNRVLGIFEETGLLGADEAARWKDMPLGVTETPGSGRNRYPAFIDLVRRQLRRDYREEDLRNEGLRIFTTLAPADQSLAERAVAGGMQDLAASGLPAGLQAALVLAEVSSGEVRALVGDRSPGRAGFNRALDARRQVGSVIKPLVYLVALEHQADYSLLTTIEDEPLTLRQPDGSIWSPKNYDGREHGQVRLLEALAGSLNLATVRLGMQLGVQQIVARLEQLGVEARVTPVPATLLGAVELTPLEVAQIYQSLAAGGYTVPLRAVTAVQTPDGALLRRYPLRMLPLERRDAVAVLNYALTQVVERGTARGLPELLGRQARVAGKTGTTNERRDSWFVGYTADRLAVTWVGKDDNSPAGVTGSNAAMRLWGRLFREMPLQPVSLDMPEGAFWTWVEPELNALSDPSCGGAVQLPFVAGSEPQSESPCLARMGRRERGAFWRKWFDRD
jgi:penicillin-binding protein 1B